MIRVTTFPRLYRDSVTLMALASKLEKLPGVERAGVMMATPANLGILAEAGLVSADASYAPDDLVVAVRAVSDEVLDEAEATAKSALSGAGADTAGSSDQPKPGSIPEALEQGFPATLACVSVPGTYAPGVIEDAINNGLHVFCFSDNISVDDEVRLKAGAVDKDLLLMGPDCGTALIDGVGLGFINELQDGPVGLISASGTGAQEVSCLLDHAGLGVSQIVGVGGRDLSGEVLGAMTHQAIDMLAADDTIKLITLISKPPHPEVADAVLRHLSDIATPARPVVACLLGLPDTGTIGEDTVVVRGSLEAAAAAVAANFGIGSGDVEPTPDVPGQQLPIVGLFTGGTLAHEAKLICQAAGVAADIHDLGDDQYTRGRPHPMIDPTPRKEWIASLADQTPGVLLLDVVLGHGSHHDPAGEVVGAVAKLREAGAGWRVIAAVTGTEADPQNLGSQLSKLEVAGIDTHLSTAAATRAALLAIGGRA